MSKKMYEETYIADIADKIREFAGTVKQYTTKEMSDGVEEVAVSGYLAGLNGIPLHYNYTPTITNVTFDELFKWGGEEGNPYTNSFRTADFSRTPNVGDVFSLIFTDRDQNKIYSFAEITSAPVQNEQGIWFSPFKILQAMLLNDGKEIADLQEAVNGLDVPLHYNYAVTLPNVTFDDLFNWQGIPGNPYTNSFRATDFSRTPKVGEMFSLLFSDKKQNKGYAFARITGPINESGNFPFAFEQAMLFHNFEEIEDLKNDVRDLENGVVGLKTRTLKFTFDDGTTDDLEVYVK